MYEIAICDDNAVFAAGFETQLSQALASRSADCHLSVFSEPASLMDQLERGQSCDLLFLDVVFAETEQGIRFAMALRERQPDTAVIFMSTDPGFALDSYDAAPLHYLKKPVDPAKLDEARDRLFRLRAPWTLRLPSAGGQIQVRVEDILYFEVYSHDITIHKAGGDTESCVGTLRDLETHLPPHTFVRPHRSYLVNLDHIAAIARYTLRMSSGDEIPVSKKLYHDVQVAFIDHADRTSRGL